MKKILVIEDSHLVQAMLGEIFKANYRLDFQNDGHSGLAAAQANPPDLILLDIRLPGIDGYDVCKALKGNDETSKIPIIFMSSRNSEADRVAGFEAGANDYVVKPFYQQELLARVKMHLALTQAKKQALRLERLALFQEMAVAISHELNNPLTAISAFIHHLQHDLAAAPPSVKAALDGISQEATRIQQIAGKLAHSSKALKTKYNKNIDMIDFRNL